VISPPTGDLYRSALVGLPRAVFAARISLRAAWQVVLFSRGEGEDRPAKLHLSFVPGAHELQFSPGRQQLGDLFSDARKLSRAPFSAVRFYTSPREGCVRYGAALRRSLREQPQTRGRGTPTHAHCNLFIFPRIACVLLLRTVRFYSSPRISLREGRARRYCASLRRSLREQAQDRGTLTHVHRQPFPFSRIAGVLVSGA